MSEPKYAICWLPMVFVTPVITNNNCSRDCVSNGMCTTLLPHDAALLQRTHDEAISPALTERGGALLAAALVENA